jgi:hypothetical protein
MSATGMVTSGMIEARTVRRKTNTTSATSTTASVIVAYTDFTERSMNTELSLATLTCTPRGSCSWMRGITSRTPLETSSGLAVAWRITPSDTDGTPLSRTLVRSFCGACSTRATSRMRTVKPLTCLTAICPNCAGVARSVCAVTLNSRCSPSMRPAGTSRFWRRSASSASCTVRR